VVEGTVEDNLGKQGGCGSRGRFDGAEQVGLSGGVHGLLLVLDSGALLS
jgi:hypothetical protein